MPTPPPPVLMEELVEEVLHRPPPVLLDELVEEVLLRLPPDEPAWLVRSSAVCKPWRRIVAAPRFRRRYSEFHRTPPLLGYFEGDASFVPTSALLPAQPPRPGLVVRDCRHGRVLLAPSNGESYEFTVLDPLTGHQIRVPFLVKCDASFTAAVLCATQGCDHHSCQGGHFLIAVVSPDQLLGFTWASFYSSEKGAWSQIAILRDHDLSLPPGMNVPGILVGDALYFDILVFIKYELGMCRLSLFDGPIPGDGRLMTAEDGGLGFAAVVDATNLTMWSMETGPGGAMGWAKLRVIDLKKLLLDGALSIPTLWRDTLVTGVAEGTQVVFVSTYVGSYMVDLKSGRARKVSRDSSGHTCFPYRKFYIPAMEAASTSQG